MHRTPRRAAAALLLAAAAACGPDASAPRNVDVVATLRSPNGAEGAAVVELSGAEVLDASTDGGRLFLAGAGGVTRVVIVRDEPGAIAFRLTVDREAPTPAAVVVEVAGPDDALRPSVDGYAVEFAR